MANIDRSDIDGVSQTLSASFATNEVATESMTNIGAWAIAGAVVIAAILSDPRFRCRCRLRLHRFFHALLEALLGGLDSDEAGSGTGEARGVQRVGGSGGTGSN